jgi:hypothetical protein
LFVHPHICWEIVIAEGMLPCGRMWPQGCLLTEEVRDAIKGKSCYFCDCSEGLEKVVIDTLLRESASEFRPFLKRFIANKIFTACAKKSSKIPLISKLNNCLYMKQELNRNKYY